MPAEYVCACGKRYRIKDEWLGRKFRCPACGTVGQADLPVAAIPEAVPVAEAVPASPGGPSNDPWGELSAASDPRNAALDADPFSANAFGSGQAGGGPLGPSRKKPARQKSGGAMRAFWAIGSLFSPAALGAFLAGGQPPQADGGRKPLPRVVSLFLGVVGMILLLGSPLFFFVAYNKYANAKASANWPCVEGVIQQSEVETFGFGRKTTYTPRIRYAYQVNGRSFTGSTINFAKARGGQQEAVAEELVRKYPVDSTQKVYYDPANPSMSVLDPGSTAMGLVGVVVGPLFAVGAAVFMILLARQELRRASAMRQPRRA